MPTLLLGLQNIASLLLEGQSASSEEPRVKCHGDALFRPHTQSLLGSSKPSELPN